MDSKKDIVQVANKLNTCKSVVIKDVSSDQIVQHILPLQGVATCIEGKPRKKTVYKAPSMHLKYTSTFSNSQRKSGHDHQGGDKNSDEDELFPMEENIEKVNTFKYLGSLKTDSGDNTNDINARIGMAKKRMQDLVNIWKDKTITLQLKIKIMKTLVWTVMTYGAEGWTIKKKQEKKINSTEMWFYRRLLRISWRERRTDQSILEELNEERKLLNYIKKRKLTFFGHTCRSKCTLMKNILQGRMEGKRQRGRPRINYFDNIKSWTQMTTREIYDVILERDVWRQMVHEEVRAANVLGNDAG
ncbi:endonuclease-reverse transcriptase [Plakobranchus ocellatus]|uniref:Endonuclease-reverse transcriptase n=1 Tax=Plakobranchus ocellatus TaxID=259542 RepID=A0AAV4E133_9GAST|nr:endonuclease-reverse transcriptase [Plakobranchus ocellatus]